jgi:hypothetical protein
MRAVALLVPGALAVHDIRYLLGYGDPEQALAQQGHGYLGSASLLAGALLALAAAELVARFARARRGLGAPGAPPRFGELWAAGSAALVLVYVLQESVEGALSAHHPAGVAGVLGHGGWTAILLAIAVGAIAALVLRGAHAVLARVSCRAPAPRRQAPAPASRGPRDFALPRPGVLARHLAGRGPPLRA